MISVMRMWKDGSMRWVVETVENLSSARKLNFSKSCAGSTSSLRSPTSRCRTSIHGAETPTRRSNIIMSWSVIVSLTLLQLRSCTFPDCETTPCLREKCKELAKGQSWSTTAATSSKEEEEHLKWLQGRRYTARVRADDAFATDWWKATIGPG